MGTEPNSGMGAAGEVRRFEYLGVEIIIKPRTPYPGIGWFIPIYSHLGERIGVRESQGAFYDDCEDHPEGAYEWAAASARLFVYRLLLASKQEGENR